MRVAVAGKGGAGKTTISATLARLAGRAGTSVVAIDADANPNLGIALGLPPEAAGRLTAIPSSAVSRRLGGAGLNQPLDVVLDRYARPAPDGVRLLSMGAPAHAEEGCLCSAHAVVSAVIEDLGQQPERLVVVDMEASPEHLSRGTIRHVDVVCLVAEPYYRSLETVRRMAALAAELPVSILVIANKIRSNADVEAITEFCQRHDLVFAGSVPWSDEVAAADRSRTAVIDWPAAHAVTVAIGALRLGLGTPTASGSGRSA
ncbi:MAG: cobyrinic acid a,c-diamide synthase [Actinomycetota bacterium]|nr:cobyrinic acid a,c-diamide synthase [Actinomycetota bacterium]